MKNYKVFFKKNIINFARLMQNSLNYLLFKRFPPFCSALALIVKDGSIYAIDHNVYNQYTFPGGYLHIKESPTEAIKREVFEETGAIVTPTKLVGCYENTSGIHSINLVYLCKIEEQIDKFSHEGKCRWMKIEDIYKSMPKHCRLALDDYKKMPKSK